MDRARGHRPALHPLCHGPDGPQSRRAVADGIAQSQRGTAAVDRRHLRLLRCRLAPHHGHAGRPHRAAKAAADRRRGVRADLDSRGVRPHGRDPDHRPGAARHSRGDAGAFDPVADHQHVPRRSRADHRHQRMGGELFDRWGNRAGGGRRAAQLFLVGLGVPRRRADHGALAAGRTAAPARVQRPAGRPAGYPQRRPVDGRRAVDHLRHQVAGRGRRAAGQHRCHHTRDWA
jgi:hypothetical protein